MRTNDNTDPRRPGPVGLYDPAFEHDSCGAGFVVNVKGKPSHRIVRQGLEILINLAHRGACGCEHNTGDGAGILIQTPHSFLAKAAQTAGFALPAPDHYGCGMVFLPRDPALRDACERTFNGILRAEGLDVIGWRTVPTNNASLGATAKSDEPCIRQVFVRRPQGLAGHLAFERKLFLARRCAERAIRYSGMPGGGHFYIASFSCKTLVYKGMLTPEQVGPYFPDLADPALDSALAVVHSRFSTNTFPSWNRAHPNRYLCHNGEINTLRGNVNWMHARESLFHSDLFGPDLKKALPILQDDGSDSAIFDNCLEFLVLAGRPLAHAVMMMIPEPWAGHEAMPDGKKAFYHYHSCLMEPWDGPASIVFTDGIQVGAVLDRNGLRPSRYYVTSDDLVIMASEVGVLDIPSASVIEKGRLQPGRMFFVDTAAGRIVADEEIKDGFAKAHPYRQWLDDNLVKLEALAAAPVPAPAERASLRERQLAFGYTFEDQRTILRPMARDGVQPLGSMGNDAPLAALSDKPQLLYNYFKQLFAQVTNPPIDPIREEIVTSTVTTLGSEGDLLNPGPANCRQIEIKYPVLTNEELARLRGAGPAGFQSATLPILFNPSGGAQALEAALDTLFQSASKAIQDGHVLLILSDRGVDRAHAPIPALLAVAGLHHHLIREGTRTRCAIILESGEPREVHHMALLLGYGAGAVNPWLAFETLHGMIAEGLLPDLAETDAVKNCVKALVKGVVKTMAKMGISTIQSYRGAQIFEAVGVARPLIDKYFTWTPSRIEGIGLPIIAREIAARHGRAFPPNGAADPVLDAGGIYQWRSDGEAHLFNPQTIHKLQLACRTNNPAVFREYSALVNDQARKLFTLRGLFEFKPAARPVPLDEVEPVEAIMKRFKTGAMSYGSISKEAHETLAIAMNRIGGKSNTGEGGEDPERYSPLPNGDSRNSAIKQVASGRFGVTSQYLVNAREIQIKMAQGAKPGEGGELPGRKVYPWIAKTRHTTPGVGLISPPPHHDIYSIEDLAELIHDLKNANRHARVSVKLVAEVGVGTIAAGVSKAHADVVLISGYDGGTGASPLSSIQHAGVPWELGLAETHQTLVLNDLRSRIAVEADGQLKTGRDIAIAALLGAEEFGFATAPLVVMGCIMMRACHLNTCPVGVATQDPALRAKFTGDPAHVVNFMRFLAADLREIMAQLGFRTLQEMVGRSDLLDTREAVSHWKAQGLDFSKVFERPNVPPTVGRFCSQPQDHGLQDSLDVRELLATCAPAIERGEKVEASFPIRNTNRVVGTITGSEITRKYGPGGLPDDTVRLHFKGSAGQSFGAFLPPGMTLTLEGDANDYLGKGLSGGRLVIFPPKDAPFAAEKNIIIGNTAFYGATSGDAFIRGMAGERFLVRNSGVNAVIEGVGDHACEYMTGGRAVILGATGRNFAAGMSGGIAYVLDPDGAFPAHVNKDMVGLHKLADPMEAAEVRRMIERHAALTGSLRARQVLDLWTDLLPKFVKVLPKDYARVLAAMDRVQAQGLSGDEAVMAAFEENSRDAARVGGN